MPRGAEVRASALQESDRAVLCFVGHNASKADTGSIINSEVDILPASAFDQIAAVAGDAMTGPLDAGKLFDVEVNEFAWTSTFIAMRGRRRIEQSETVQLVAAQDARNARLRERALACDLESGHAQSAQRQHDRDLRWRDLSGATIWTRGAIKQPGSSLGPKAG
jgi:hypothetical protein